MNVLAYGQPVETCPTIGLNVKVVRKDGVQFKVWDVGGQQQYRSEWGRYTRGCDVIIFVVDTHAVSQQLASSLSSRRCGLAARCCRPLGCFSRRVLTGPAHGRDGAGGGAGGQGAHRQDRAAPTARGQVGGRTTATTPPELTISRPICPGWLAGWRADAAVCGRMDGDGAGSYGGWCCCDMMQGAGHHPAAGAGQQGGPGAAPLGEGPHPRQASQQAGTPPWRTRPRRPLAG